jgi:diketogulonate reductase-like aldo/keto reductase
MPAPKLEDVRSPRGEYRTARYPEQPTDTRRAMSAASDRDLPAGGMPSRRTVMKAALVTGLTGALVSAGGCASAQSQLPTAAAAATGAPPAPGPGGEVITREIPRTRERLPVVGLGSFMTFDQRPAQPREHLRETLNRFWNGGGRTVDTSPLYGLAEVNVGDLAADAGIADRLFITGKTWATGEYLGDFSHARRQLEQSKARLWRNQLDVLQVHNLVSVEVNVPILRHFKREGHIRYLGVTHHDPLYYPALEHWIRTGDLDFIQVHYSIQHRLPEQRILPLAAERGTAVMVNMPLEKHRLHNLVRDAPLPGFAAESGCQNWAQFFLKYVVSHPAVTCALPATSNPDHLTENLGAMRGELPDQPMRDRMVRHMETIPGFNELQSVPWYPGKSFSGVVSHPPVPSVT